LTAPAPSESPDPARAPAPLPAQSLALLLLSVLLGAAAAALAMPAIFRATPTDISRIGVLLAALRDPAAAPQVVVFGNSMIMSGVDGRQLAAELPGQPLAWNLASSGQSLAESFLFYQQLPQRLRYVVQQVQVGVVEQERPLEAQKYNTFYMNGFRPQPATRAALDASFGAPVTGLLDASDLSQRFQARWALRQLVDTRLRLLLRRDLSLESAEVDLFHPQRYAKPLPPRRTQALVEGDVARLRSGTPQISTQKLRLLESMQREAAARQARFVALLPPVHPAIREALGPALREPLDAFARAFAGREGALVVDLSDALEAQHFIDNVHPTNAGAEIATRLLARRMGGRD
jgi:hypothetical protein